MGETAVRRLISGSSIDGGCCHAPALQMVSFPEARDHSTHFAAATPWSDTLPE